ncbi:hypothetical protein Tco_1298167 [Tanacetum coccineum]
MSTQQDIYVVGSENHPPMLNKDNYVSWSSRLLHYAKIKPNGKLIYNSIMHGPYVRRMILEPGDPDWEVLVVETFHEQTNEELAEKEVKQMEAADQGIHTILMGLPKDIYAVDDSCETAQEIWLRVEVNELRAERLTRAHDPLALMANSNNPYNYPVFHQDQPSQVTYMQQPQHNNKYIPQPSFNTNYMQQPMPNPEDITDPTTAMNMELNVNQNGNGNVVAAWAEGNGNGHGNSGNRVRCYNCREIDLQTQLLIAQKEEAGIQLQDEEFDFMASTGDLDEIEEVNANYRSAEVHEYDNCYNNEIFNMFTQTEQYTELLESIPEPYQVQQNDSNVISVVSNVIFVVSSMEQSGGTIEQYLATVEETHAYFESLYNNLAIKVEKVNSINRKMKETNAELTITLARYKNQENCFEINQEKYDKLERCYQKFVYQEKFLTKKINALHLSSAKMITTLNEENANLNNQLSKEKSTISYLQQEKKNLKSDFKIREDELLDKQIQLENKIKELDNILIYIIGRYNGKVLLENHDPPDVYDLEETLQLAQESDESLAKHKALEFEIKRLLRVVVSRDIMSIVQNPTVVETSDLQTELEHMKERFENCIIKKDYEYAKLWNDWYKKCEECKYDKISYDKAYNDMQQKIKQLQAQLGDLKGKSEDTSCVSDTLDTLSQKLEDENVELEFQVLNYAKENVDLMTTYKNLFDCINVTRNQTKTIIESFQEKLHNMIYENATLRA